MLCDAFKAIRMRIAEGGVGVLNCQYIVLGHWMASATTFLVWLMRNWSLMAVQCRYD